jgi:hypothetical protein
MMCESEKLVTLMSERAPVGVSRSLGLMASQGSSDHQQVVAIASWS